VWVEEGRVVKEREGQQEKKEESEEEGIRRGREEGGEGKKGAWPSW